MRAFALIACLLLASIASLSQAETIRLTVYDDGRACPGNCDAHVVFREDLNGSDFAHIPGTQKGKCVDGQKCEICIESGRKQCLEVTYRGAGPTGKTFDLTPSFFREACEPTPAQPALAAKCKALIKEVHALDGRINCIATPDNAKCAAMIAKAKAAQALDQPKYEQCALLGEYKYNKDKPKAERRVDKCSYEWLSNGGPNSKGVTWRRLLPGACRQGNYVGPYGTDCCTGVQFEDGPKGIECTVYYPKP
ncbi:hypothetical protein V4Z64_005170 [Pseudomonas aeruginosa]|uniref:hypothetical protein n=1 Tax=Pseudomonas aeruginosa TaxID=287 RepID=UPI000F52B5BF|nr:hypothetical protein [Pseudomonas aeruginosa]MBA5106109.1 hypothetical protein [Pseudomonas aeruginosa]MDP5990044.1 hypothetical protein [Pseudomonas aeruginosa]HCE9175762.1 hypothetical protein [Pseudomonas aeruginosa]HEO1611801.1 hypothetical protein [Pseudomonas aeruginosa]